MVKTITISWFLYLFTKYVEGTNTIHGYKEMIKHTWFDSHCFKKNMLKIIKFVNVRIIFLSLFLFAMNVEGQFPGQFQRNWAKPCSLHSDCSNDMCKPPFKPACLDYMCMCRFFKIEN